MSAIKQLYRQLEPTIAQNENKIFTDFTKTISGAYTEMMKKDDGYCFTFILPMTMVKNLITTLKTDENTLLKTFQADWGRTLTQMHNDSYYQILLIVLYYALMNNKKYLADNTLMLILMKVWNGRKRTFFRYCDPKVMNYVVNNMMTRRHHMNKYDSPISLLKDYFVPSILKKYAPEIQQDIGKLKRLFEQCYGRIFQLFLQNPKINLDTKQKENQGGLLHLYLKAKEEGLHMSSMNVRSGEDDDSSFDQYSSTSNRDEIVNTVVDKITMNPNPTYPLPILQQINKNTKVANKIIEKILTSIHEHKNHNILTDVLSIILTKTNIVDKSDICSSQFKDNIKRNIISSKNNPDVKKLQSLLNTMLEDILPKILNVKLSQYSNVHQMQIRNVIVYGLEYNLIKNICR